MPGFYTTHFLNYQLLMIDPREAQKTLKNLLRRQGGLRQFFGVIFRNDTCESTGIALIKTFYGMKKYSRGAILRPFQCTQVCPKIALFLYKALCKNDQKMALLGLKMALIHPKKVQIGYKLDKNTNLVNTFENNRRKCKKVKIQQNMDDFHLKISIRC